MLLLNCVFIVHEAAIGILYGLTACTSDVAAVASHAVGSASCRLRGGYPGVFPNNTAPRPPAKVRDPDQHVFIGYRAHGGLAETGATAVRKPPRHTAERDQTIGTRPRRSPARPTVRCCCPTDPPCAFPRTRVRRSSRRYSRRSADSGRPLVVVNTCSVRVHASYVINLLADQFVFYYLFCLVFICSSAYRCCSFFFLFSLTNIVTRFDTHIYNFYFIHCYFHFK